jgi:succinate dehydrogenase / fumarate reductase cytochrome b subunit
VRRPALGSKVTVAIRTRNRKQKDDFGSVYRGHEGQWSWLFHRVTGVAIILFLFAHIVDTAVIGWGPEAYNRVTAAYKNPVVHVLELGLVLAVLFHSINGIKITLIDFFPRLVSHIRAIGIAFATLFVVSAVIVTVIMGKQVIDLL